METLTCDDGGADLGRFTPSHRIIAEMMAANPKIRNRGFMPDMREAFPALRDFLADFSTLIPDAHRINHERKEVYFIEVVDNSPITKAKGADIGDLSDLLQGEGWNLQVIAFDAAGNVSAIIPGVFYMTCYAHLGGLADDATPAAKAAHRLAHSG